MTTTLQELLGTENPTEILKLINLLVTQKSNIDLSNLSSVGQAKFDAKVSKSGDTMSGSLLVQGDISQASSGRINLLIGSASKGTTPSANRYQSFVFNDTDDTHTTWQSKRFGVCETQVLTNGNTALRLGTYFNTANSDNGAFLDLQTTQAGVASCLFPNTTCVDGQWVSLSSQNNSIASDVTLPIGNDLELEYDLSSYLPNDGYNYEVTFSVDAETGNGSGAGLYISLMSSLSWRRICGITARGSWVVTMGNNATCIIGTNRKVKLLYTVTSKNAKLNGFFIEGYRRLGTNA